MGVVCHIVDTSIYNHSLLAIKEGVKMKQIFILGIIMMMAITAVSADIFILESTYDYEYPAYSLDYYGSWQICSDIGYTDPCALLYNSSSPYVFNSSIDMHWTINFMATAGEGDTLITTYFIDGLNLSNRRLIDSQIVNLPDGVSTLYTSPTFNIPNDLAEYVIIHMYIDNETAQEPPSTTTSGYAGHVFNMSASYTPCTPTFDCNSFESCVSPMESASCLSVVDLTCGNYYTGNVTAFDSRVCVYESTGGGGYKPPVESRFDNEQEEQEISSQVKKESGLINRVWNGFTNTFKNMWSWMKGLFA